MSNPRWLTGGHFENYNKFLITPKICELVVSFVLPAYRKSGSTNLMVIPVFIYDLPVNDVNV